MRGTWESGQKVIKCIGFDSTEDHRTYSDGGNLSVCPSPGLPAFGQRYTCRYPLREWGFSRDDCGRIITAAGLPLPPKSACFFCPAAKVEEIQDLASSDPVYFRMALEMERRYREGRHFRGDTAFTVTAKHQQTGEIVKVEMFGANKAIVREQFRNAYDDTAKPHKYKLGVSPAVAGLGRNFAWKSISLPVL